MAYEFIRYEEARPHVVRLTLQRPERLNALHGPLLAELADAVERIDADEEVRVWLLTGAPRPDGRPCFGAGVDLRSFAEGKGVSIQQGLALSERIDEMLKPSIAAIDGVCTTGAAELALAFDFRLVGAAARISDWHLKNLGTGLGAWGASTRWVRLLGVQRAKELILTGRELGAEEAVDLGFALSAHPSEDLQEAALDFADKMVDMKREGVRMVLAHLDRAAEMGRRESVALAGELYRWLGADVDMAGKEKTVLGGKRQ